MSAYNASPIRSWILNPEASSHITCIKQKFVSLNIFNKFPLVNIADGTQSSVLGNGVVQAIPSLTLIDILFVPKFSIIY